MYKDNPLLYIENLFENLMFAGCALGRDIGGLKNSFRLAARRGFKISR